MVRKYYNKVRKTILKKIEYGNKHILNGNEGNMLIANKIKENSPLNICRIGATELEVLNYYLYKDKKYDKYIREKIAMLSGVFPPTDEVLNEFSSIYLDAIANADAIGIWYNKGEGKIIDKFNGNCNVFELRGLEPYYWEGPWSKMLEGKKVLVIHPFKESIEEQFEKREKLFENKNILPKFELKIIKAVQSIAGNEVQYSTWIEALDYMKSEIDNVEFDIAIIGAGAYGLPLASYIKAKNKQAIHLGGATQILFGVKGKRWDNHDVIGKMYNSSWIRPKSNDTCKGNNKVEGGCYW